MTIKDDREGQSTMKMQVGEENANVTITGEDGNVAMVSGAGTGIPEGFPKDVPVHPSLQVNMSLTDGATGFTIHASSKEKFDNIVYYYQQEVPKLGWTEQMNMQQNPDAPMQMLIYEKDNRMLNLVIQQEDEAVNITISVAKE